jgi:hypothetical protein
MSRCGDANSLNLRQQAEREMAAFLEATAGILGPHSCSVAADAWFHTLESLNWPASDHQNFFRCVSILAISQIASNIPPRISLASARGIDGTYLLPAFQSGY